VRDRWLEGVETVIQRQKRVAAERNDHSLIGLGEDRRPRLFWPGLKVLDRCPLSPFRDRLGVDAQFAAQLRERSLRSLYCSSDGVRGRGAAVTNLAHSASFHSFERIAPSNCGTKHLTQDLGLERLLAEQAVQFADLPLKRAIVRGWHHLLAGRRRGEGAVGGQPSPGEKLVRVHVMAPRHQADRGARLQVLLDHSHLLGGVPAPAPLHGGDDLHLLWIVSHTHGHTPNPYGSWRPCPGNSGAASGTAMRNMGYY